MPVFPEKEAEVVALAEPLFHGLLSNIPIYPNPPVTPFALRMKSLVYKNRCEVLLAKKARAETTTTAKDDALEDLIEALKSNIRYAGNTVNFNDAKLKTYRLERSKRCCCFDCARPDSTFGIAKTG